MMMCDECKVQEATFHYKSKINGVTTERHLCPDCQAKLGFGSQVIKLSGLGGFFSSLTGAGGSPKFVGNSAEQNICSGCGTTAQDFLDTGYVGCQQCYKKFMPTIGAVIKKMQGADTHTGKTPGGAKSVYSKLEKLQNELEKAVKAENFEQASIIIAEIEKIKAKEGKSE